MVNYKVMIIPLIFFISITFGALGAILMKLGASHLGVIEFNSVQAVFKFILKLFTNFTILSGMFLYFLSAVAWTFLLTKLDISYVQPILSLTYLLTPILSFLIIGEHVPLARWVGIGIIIIGVYVIAKTSGS